MEEKKDCGKEKKVSRGKKVTVRRKKGHKKGKRLTEGKGQCREKSD